MRNRRWVLIGCLLFTAALSGLAVMPTAWASPPMDELRWTVPTRTPTSTLTPRVYLPLVFRGWPLLLSASKVSTFLTFSGLKLYFVHIIYLLIYDIEYVYDVLTSHAFINRISWVLTAKM